MKKILLTVRCLATSAVAMIFLVNTVSGQVATLQNWTNEYHGSSTSEQIITYSVPEGSDANRLLVIAIASANNFPYGPITVVLTYGGQSLTLADGDMGSTNIQHTAFYYLDEAGLDAATDQTLSVTVSGGTIRLTDVWAAVFDYVNQTSPITDSQTSTTGTSPLYPPDTIYFDPVLTIEPYNQAVEIICTHNTFKNNPCNINYATYWTMTDEQIIGYTRGFSSFSIKHAIASRSLPVSSTTDSSATSFDKTTLVSMTSLSLNYEIPPPPTIQASDIFFTDITTSSFTINWTPGDGTNRLVLVKEGSAVDSDPVDGTTYTASNLFGDGSEIGTGNFVVYDGTGNSVTVENLNANTTYYVAVYEFSGPPGLEDYLTPPATGSQLTAPETAVTDDYRSNGSGNWSDAGVWQTFDGISWVTAGTPPNSTSGIITIRNGHTITVDADVTADQVVIVAGAQVTVNSGITWTIADGADAVDCSISGTIYSSGTITATGDLAFNSGSTYQHARDGGTIPAATWDANSICLITGITATGPAGFGQSFGNFTWNCISQTASAAMNSDVTIKGNFRITSTGTGNLAVIDNNTSRTVTLTGNFIQTGGTFVFNNGASSTAAAYLYVAGNFSFTGGTITEISNGRGSIIFNGNGAMQLYTSGGSLSNIIDFTVSSGAYLQMGTGLYPSIISNSTGTFTLSSGATLGITDQWGITISATGPFGGNIRVTGTRTFSTEANYIYNGATTQNTGDGLPSTVHDLVFNNTVGAVNFNSARTITNSFSITTGSKTNLGNGLFHTAGFLLLGGIAQPSGSYGGVGSGADYELPEYFNPSTGIVNNSPPNGTWLGNTIEWDEDSNWIGGVPDPAGNAIISSFAPNQPVISATTIAICNILTLNTGATLDIAGTAVFTSAENNGNITINPGGTATITNLINNGTLDLESDASEMFSLMLDNYSGTTGSVNVGLYLTGGNPGSQNWRWHYLAVPFQQNKSVLTNINPEDLMNYLEPSAVTDMSEGWQWHDGYEGTTPFNDLLVTEGYNFYNDVNSYVTFTGNSLMTSLPVKNLSFTIFGWNFFGNSLTCGINWDNVILDGDMNTAVHFLKDYQEYYYIQGGPGVPSGTTGHIPPLQGFFVQAYASGASIDFSGAREHNDVAYYKGDKGNNEVKGSLPLIRLALKNGSQTDEAVVWFNDEATMEFDNKFDARKFVSRNTRPQIYSVSPGREYAINGIPSPSASVSIPLGITIPEDGTYTISQISLENVDNYGFYLKDLAQNSIINLNSIPEYSFSESKGIAKNRFVLIIENRTAGSDDNHGTGKPFNIYSSYGFVNIEVISDMWDGQQGSVKITDLTGRTLTDSRNMEFNRSSLIQLPLRENKGIFIIEISSGKMRHTARIVLK